LGCVGRCGEKFTYDMTLAADPNEGGDENLNTQEQSQLQDENADADANANTNANAN